MYDNVYDIIVMLRICNMLYLLTILNNVLTVTCIIFIFTFNVINYIE